MIGAIVRFIYNFTVRRAHLRSRFRNLVRFLMYESHVTFPRNKCLTISGVFSVGLIPFPYPGSRTRATSKEALHSPNVYLDTRLSGEEFITINRSALRGEARYHHIALRPRSFALKRTVGRTYGQREAAKSMGRSSADVGSKRRKSFAQIGAKRRRRASGRAIRTQNFPDEKSRNPEDRDYLEIVTIRAKEVSGRNERPWTAVGHVTVRLAVFFNVASRYVRLSWASFTGSYIGGVSNSSWLTNRASNLNVTTLLKKKK